ncbi:thymidine phosphorylase [Paracoccaceae bacterium]|nr:thymidine phosphorylase [Paracoccaceae bacterium]MDC3204964.1 thymidine phosphorylase [Paracoccaceae bacterium]
MKNFNAQAILAKVRNKSSLSRDEMVWFAKGLSDGKVTDAQAGAFSMAVALNGLGSQQARTDWTLAMRDSGKILSWEVGSPVLDKHSTGGIGDCVSLILAPLLASIGVCVPMISGRGLGHTGGTLDKLESIPGVKVMHSEKRLVEIIESCGCIIAGANEKIAPADRRLYAVRDVTSTVDSLDLITASILSKKLASGLDGLVLDIKCGSGAFMADLNQATELAKALVKTANEAGCATTALITDMNQPLAPAMGNALEIVEAMRVLSGETVGRLRSITLSLGAEILKAQKIYNNISQATNELERNLDSGAALKKFSEMISLMGGPINFGQDFNRYLPEATAVIEVFAPEAGYLAQWDGQSLGNIVVKLGGGRLVETDQVDHAVGFSEIASIGTKLSKGSPILKIHAARIDHAEEAKRQVLAAFKLSDSAPKETELVLKRIT